MAKIEISVLADEVQAKLQQLQAAGADMRPAYTNIGNTLVERIRQSFRFSRSPWGGTWAPLKTRSGKPLLNSTGLRKSILPKVDAKGVTVGTNKKVDGGTASLGAVHQFGATIVPKPSNRSGFLWFQVNGRTVRAKQVTIPARPFMPIRPAGNIDLPPAWSKAILRNLAAHFGLEVQGATA